MVKNLYFPIIFLLCSLPNFGSYEIEWIVEDEYLEFGDFFEGDIKMNEDQIDAVFGNRNAVNDGKYHWPHSIVPYQQSPNHSAKQNAWILKAMKKIESVSCVRFRPRTIETDYVQIQASNNGCYSEVGRQGGEQILNLKDTQVGAGCFKVGTIIHELLHTLGFYHMQSAPDRDDYVKINWENIRKNCTKNFKKYNSMCVSNFNISYDYFSIMHYHSEAFSKGDGLETIEPLTEDEAAISSMGQRKFMSAKDKLRLNAVYKCAQSSDAPTT